MKPLKVIGATILSILVISCVHPMGVGRTVSGGVETTARDTFTVETALAKAGYISAPIHWESGYPIVQAQIAATPISLLLDSGSPFDLLLDNSLHLNSQSGLHMTGVQSGYWTFSTAQGNWAILDRMSVGQSTLEGLEAKVESSPSPLTKGVFGATALSSQGAVIDYTTNTLYLPASHDLPKQVQLPGVELPTLRAALERAGQYRTFLALMQEARLASLLDSATDATASRDSIAWLSLRVGAEQLSGVGGMPPNDMHLELTRRAVAQDLQGSKRRTLFAPTDEAFARLPSATLQALRADTARLAQLLLAHFYMGASLDTSSMRTLIRGAAHPGPGGSSFGFHVLGKRIDVDRLASWEDGRVVARAAIVQPDMQVSHGVAVAHGIDQVLGPFAAQQPFVAALTRQGYIGVPLHRSEDGNTYLVHATVNGTSVSLTVATGAHSEVVLDKQWVARLQPSNGNKWVVAFDTLKIGTVNVETADFSRQTKSLQMLGYRASAGTIGSVFLAQYHALIDFATGTLYLQLPAPH